MIIFGVKLGHYDTLLSLESAITRTEMLFASAHIEIYGQRFVEVLNFTERIWEKGCILMHV